jgi:hypothetical protein
MGWKVSGRGGQRISQAVRADGVNQHVRGPDLSNDLVNERCRHGGVGGIGHLGTDVAGEFTQLLFVPVDRHYCEAGRGERRCRRATKRTACTSHDGHLGAHGVNRPRIGRNQHIHACPWWIGSAVLRSRVSP